uniref:PD-(D/E)XK nuclease family protein n=1 Tax=Brachyspira sp. TaxID=1977261 RepID=UPI003D7DDC0A
MAKNLNIKNIENILLPLINAFQNDEKEKLNYLGSISKSLIEVREKVKAEMEKLPPQFNVLNSIRRKTSVGRLLTYEPYNSDLLSQLLKIKKEKINFAKLFLEFMNDKFKNKIDLNNINWGKVEVENEYKHIDILIRYKKSLAVIIENKIGYIDRDRQLEKYYNIMSKEEGCGNNVYAIYLTPEGKEPSENSLPEEYYKKEDGELYGKFANIKHAEIGYWLESILKRQEFSFLNNEEENNKYNYKLLKSALIQIIDNEKSISGENEESDMTKDEIENVLKENLFKEIKTVEKAQEYIDMFENAKVLL